jgi:hypothetical protein
MDLYVIAHEYSKLPRKGQIAEKIRAERNEKRVYHTEYKKAENSAAKEDAGGHNMKVSVKMNNTERITHIL